MVHFKNRSHAKLKGAPEAEAAKTDAFRKLEKRIARTAKLWEDLGFGTFWA